MVKNVIRLVSYLNSEVEGVLIHEQKGLIIKNFRELLIGERTSPPMHFNMFNYIKRNTIQNSNKKGFHSTGVILISSEDPLYDWVLENAERMSEEDRVFWGIPTHNESDSGSYFQGIPINDDDEDSGYDTDTDNDHELDF